VTAGNALTSLMAGLYGPPGTTNGAPSKGGAVRSAI
jgi:hypothetical protein